LSSIAHSVQLIFSARRPLLVSTGVLVALSIGCGDGPTDPAPAVPGSITAASATVLSGTVGQPVTPLPSVIVRNQHGDPMFGVRVNFAVTGGDGSITGATAFTDANGVATVGSWTLGPAVGDNTLSATVGSLTPVTFVAVAQAGEPASLTKSEGDEQTGPVATALPIAPAVLVEDLLGNPVAGVSVVFEVESGGGSVANATAITSSVGIATAGEWTLGTTPGPNTLTATAGELTVTFTATAVAGDPVAIAKEDGDNQTATVGEAVDVAPSVEVTDAHGNPVPGVDVTFAVASGGGSVDGALQVTDADGIATVESWTLGTAVGTNTLTATAGSLTTTFTATATVGLPASLEKTAGDGQTDTVGTTVSVDPTVRLTDEHGNPIAGAAVVFAVASGGGSVSGANQITDSDGVATVGSWMLGTSVGENTLTATGGGLSETFTATAIPGAPEIIEKQDGDGETAIVNTAVSPRPTVLVTDIHGNPVSDVAVTFVVATGGGLATGEEQVTDADGLASVGSWTLGTTAGENTLTATADDLIATFTATGVADVPSAITIVEGDGQSAAEGENVPEPPSVRVEDEYGNSVEGVAVTFTVTGGGLVNGMETVDIETDVDGIATVESWTLGAGPNELTATAGSAGSVVFTAALLP
jgi:adhesin/invasin